MSEDGYHDVAELRADMSAIPPLEVHKAGCQRLSNLSRTCNCGEGTILERPVSSQLSRIESGLDTLLQCQAGFEQNIVKQIAAVLEGQARLNSIIDKVGQRQELIRQQSIQQIEHVQERISELNALVDGMRQGIKQIHDERIGMHHILGISERLAAIEANLAQLIPTTTQSTSPAALAKYVTQRFKQRSASKKPSHKARRAKRST